MPPQYLTTAVVFLLSCLLINADKVFIDTPTSVNASLGSMVHLRCTARCRTISWKIDGISATKPEVVQRNIRFSSESLSQNKVQSTLHILASVANNNTVIVCRAVVAPGTIISAEEAVLRVQGLLGAPSNLQVLAAKKSIDLRWSAPFTLNITNSEPDILNYTLHINNLTSDQVTAVNVTDTNFTFQVVDPNACHTYKFQVSAWSMSGEGYRSEPVEVPYSIHYRQLSAVVTFSPSGIPNVQLRVERATAVCKGKQPDYFTVVLQGTYDSKQQVFMQEINSTQQKESRITLKLPRTLAPNEIYNALVIPGNAAGNSIFSTGSILISTFDTQAAYVTVMDSGDICVTCYFAEGTNAQGCMVVLATSMSVTLKNLTAFRNNNSAKLCDKIENGVSTEDRYTCKVYDVERNAEVGNQPAYSIRRVPVISPQNITYTATTDGDLCTRQKNSTINRGLGPTATPVAIGQEDTHSKHLLLYGSVAGCGAVVLILSLVIVVLCCCCKCQRSKLTHKGSHSTSRNVTGIAMETCPAYVVITGTQQSTHSRINL